MRKGISSLCGVVHERMGCSVKNGDVFIFIGSSRKLMEAGRFKIPVYDKETKSYPMEWRDLVVMVEGIQESPEKRLRRLRAERKEYIV